jgi:hypothetical protein
MAFLDGLFPAGFFTGEFGLKLKLFSDGICTELLSRELILKNFIFLLLM